MWPYEEARRYLWLAWGWTLYTALPFVIHLFTNTKHRPPEITGDECRRAEGPPETRRAAVRSYGSTMEDIEDTVDFLVASPVGQALEKVCGAIYKVCFSVWHCPPEKMEEQPLYKEIHTAIDSTFTNIRAKARPMEEYELLLAVTNALNVHLKSLQKKQVASKYNSEQEEVDFLRKQIRCLLLYWLPDSLRNSDHILVFLNEILSINVLGPAMNNLSDVNVINELIVRMLGSGVYEKRHDLDKYSGNMGSVSCSLLQASHDGLHSDVLRKKERKGCLRKLKGSEKHPEQKELESDTGFRAYSREEEEDTVDTDSSGWNGSGNDDDDLTLSVCDLALQKWRKESWTAACENTTDKHIFKIRVCDKNSGNTELWITERSIENFKQIYDILSKRYQVFNRLKESKETTTDFFQAIDTTPDRFIDILVKLIIDHEEPEAIIFLFPFKYDEEDRELFNTALSDNDEDFTTDESKSENEPDLENDEGASDSSGCHESDGFRALKLRKKKNHKKHNKDLSSESEVSSGELDLKHTATSRNNFKSSIESSIVSDEAGVLPHNKTSEEKTKQRKKFEDRLLSAVGCLCEELFAGGRLIFKLLNTAGLVQKHLLNNIPKLYAEDQIVWYLNQTSELLLSKAEPLPYPPHELKSMAQALLKGKLHSLLPNMFLKMFFEKRILKGIMAFHEAFQSQKANKETLFRLLEDLTMVIINGSQECKRD